MNVSIVLPLVSVHDVMKVTKFNVPEIASKFGF